MQLAAKMRCFAQCLSQMRACAVLIESVVISVKILSLSD